MGLVEIDIINVCWTVFILVWLLAAIFTKHTVYRESRVSRLRYVIPIAIGALLLFRGDRLRYPLNVRIIPHTAAIGWAGAFLCVAGLSFCLWARLALGRNWSGTITLKEGHELVTRGPYRVARHPIYTGLLMMFWATILVSGHLAGLIGGILVFVGFWTKLSDEEQLMLKKFPDQYPAYQRQAKRIIPFVV